jgi:hypothetical protein
MRKMKYKTAGRMDPKHAVSGGFGGRLDPKRAVSGRNTGAKATIRHPGHRRTRGGR